MCEENPRIIELGYNKPIAWGRFQFNVLYRENMFSYIAYVRDHLLASCIYISNINKLTKHSINASNRKCLTVSVHANADTHHCLGERVKMISSIFSFLSRVTLSWLYTGTRAMRESLWPTINIWILDTELVILLLFSAIFNDIILWFYARFVLVLL